MEQTRIVFKPNIARRLIHEGYSICDIKPQRQTDGTIDYTRVTFLFEYKEGIDEIINEMTSRHKNV